MQRNFIVNATQGELTRELRITTNHKLNAYTLLKAQKNNKKWDFDVKDIVEVNVLWQAIENEEEVVEAVEEEVIAKGE